MKLTTMISLGNLKDVGRRFAALRHFFEFQLIDPYHLYKMMNRKFFMVEGGVTLMFAQGCEQEGYVGKKFGLGIGVFLFTVTFWVPVWLPKKVETPLFQHLAK